MVKRQLQLDATKGIKTVKDLKAAVESYNETIRRYNKVAKEQAKTTKKVSKAFKEQTKLITDERKSLIEYKGAITNTEKSVRSLTSALEAKNKAIATQIGLWDSLQKKIGVKGGAVGQFTGQKTGFPGAKKLGGPKEEIEDAEFTVKKEQKAIEGLVTSQKKLTDNSKNLTSAYEKKNKKLKTQINRNKEDSKSAKESSKSNKQNAAAANEVGAAYLRNTRIFSRFLDLFNRFLFLGVLFKLQQMMRDSVGDAQRLIEAISEIRTISDRAEMSTDKWRKSLIEVSNTFGIDVITSAEAAYQSLSNQITEAGTTQQFLAEEAKLAIIAVSELDDAVQTTTSVLNAFDKEIEETSTVNAILFQTVEQGRTRLSEMANTLGRVNIMSSQLKISFLEQQAAISFLTRQGLKTEEALTLLRNVELRLLKPTSEMNELFDKWGIASGQAAIQAFGLIGTMRQLSQAADQAGDQSGEFAKLLGRLRSITGGVALSQDAAAKEMDKFKGSGERAFGALEERMESYSKRAQIQLERAKNFFLEAVGQKVVKELVNFIEKLGGAEEALRILWTLFKQGVISVTAYALAIKLINTRISMYNFKVAIANAQTAQHVKLLKLQRFQMLVAQPLIGAVAIGVGVLAERFLFASNNAQKLSDKIHSMRQNFETDFNKIQALADAAFDSFLIDQDVDFRQSLDEIRQSYGRFIAALEQGNNAILRNFDDTYEKIGEKMKDAIAEPTKKLRQELSNLQSKIEDLRSSAKGREEGIAQRKRDFAFDTLKKDLNSQTGPLTGQISEFDRAIKFLQIKAREELKKGNEKAFEDFANFAEAIVDEKEKKLEQIRKAASKVEKIQGIRPEFDARGRLRLRKGTIAEQQKDPALAKKALQEIIKLEAQRKDLVRDRIKEEEKFIQRQRNQAAAEQKKLEARKKSFQQFEKLLTKIDTFQGKSKDLGALITQAGVAGRDAGIDPIARLEFLREARKQQALLFRKEMALDAKKHTEQLRKDTDLMAEELERRKTEFQKIQREIRDALTGYRKEAGGLVTEAGAALEVTSEGFFSSKRSEKKVQKAVAIVEGIKDALKKAKPEEFEKLKKDLKSAREFLSAVQGDLLQNLRASEADKNNFGGSLGGKARYEERLKNRLANLGTASRALAAAFKQLAKGQESLKRRADARKAVDELNKAMAKSRQLIIDQQNLHPDLAKLAKESWTIQKLQAREYDQVLKSIEARLNKVANIQSNIGARPGQRLPNFAFGGRVGFDNQLAMLRKNEIVLNPMEVRRLQTTSQPEVSQTFNFGNINVSDSNTGVSIVNEVIRELQQRKRLNLI